MLAIDNGQNSEMRFFLFFFSFVHQFKESENQGTSIISFSCV